MSKNIYCDIAQAYAAAAEKAPGLKARFTSAGFNPADVSSLADLSRLPVMKKEELLKIQRDNPPFGGFLATDMKEVGRIYVSPGPIFEPTLSGGGGHGLDLLFKAAGVGAGDIILNTWMYITWCQRGFCLTKRHNRSGQLLFPVVWAIPSFRHRLL